MYFEGLIKQGRSFKRKIVFNAVSYTDAEAILTEYVTKEFSFADFKLSIKELSKIEILVRKDKEQLWFKATVTNGISESGGKELSSRILFNADNFNDAIEYLHSITIESDYEGARCTMIKETDIYTVLKE